MSTVRVLVGTRKGAFILTSDGKRQKWDVTGPHFGGWEIYHLKGSPVDPEPHLRLANQRLVRPDHPALRRRRQNLAPARHPRRANPPNPVRPKARATSSSTTPKPQAAHHAPVVRRHAASLGIQTRLASRAVAHRSRHGLRRRRRRRDLPLHRRRQDLARTGRPARPRHRPQVAARRRRHGPAHDPARSHQSQAHLHRHLRGRRLPHRRRRQNLEADQPRPAIAIHSRPGRRSRPLRPPHRHASRRAPTCCSCRNTGTSCAPTTPATTGQEVSGNLPTDFGFSIDVHAHEPETIYVVPIKSDSRALSARRQAARLPQPQPAATTGKPLTKGLPQENCYVNVLRDAMAVDTLDPCGIYFGTTGGQVYASPDAGDSWNPIVRDLPAVLSVEVQTIG